MNRCAFPDCQTPIIDSQTNTILAQVCHIHAENEGGLRFDPSQTNEDRRAYENLILLCSRHHKIIDAPENLATYTATHLKHLKANHEQAARTSEITLPTLTSELLSELQESSARYERDAVHMDFRHAVFRAGGEGGVNGGGGGGGIITIVGSTRLPPSSIIDLEDSNAKTPYGGGGGGGVIQFVGRAATLEDVASGLRVSSLFTANAVVISELFHVLGGGWSFCPLPTVPSQVNINVVCVLELGTIAPETLLQINIEILNPQGSLICTDSRDIAVPSSTNLTPRFLISHILQFEVNELGSWTIRVTSADIVLANYGIEFKLHAST